MGKDRVYLSEKKLHTRHVIRPCPCNKNHFFFFFQMNNIYLKCKIFSKVIFYPSPLCYFIKKLKNDFWAQLKLFSQTAHLTFNCCRPKLTAVKTKLTDTNICSIPGCQWDTRNNAQLLVLKYILETGWTLHPGSMKVLSLITENVQPAGRRWSRVRDRHRPLFL